MSTTNVFAFDQGAKKKNKKPHRHIFNLQQIRVQMIIWPFYERDSRLFTLQVELLNTPEPINLFLVSSKTKPWIIQLNQTKSRKIRIVITRPYLTFTQHFQMYPAYNHGAVIGSSR